MVRFPWIHPKESLYTSETQGHGLNDVKFKLNILSQTLPEQDQGRHKFYEHNPRIIDEQRTNWSRGYIEFSLPFCMSFLMMIGDTYRKLE